MDKRQEIEDLRKQILDHNDRYYNHDKPLITDSDYDALYVRLKQLEAQYPQFDDEKSPTKKIGGSAALNIFKPVVHLAPMMSLDNTYNAQDIILWNERCQKTLAITGFEMAVESKIDGISCSLRYKDSILACAATRGDGNTGEDITQNIFTIKTIPQKLKTLITGTFEVRGEVFMDKADFDALNKKQQQLGLPCFANARNAAAGSLRQKNAAVTALRPLKFYAHSMGIGNLQAVSFTDFMDKCAQLGLPISPLREVFTDINDVITFYNNFKNQLPALPYDADGLVVKINNFTLQKTLGFTAKSPRWAVAFKYPAQQVQTMVKNIVFSVGRTGVITPVAELAPVACAGVIISNATLHNFDEISRLDIRIGDSVLIERAGEVIPKIIQVIRHATASIPIPPPQLCPVCQSHIFKDDDGVAYRCINPNCPAQIKAHIAHFASRTAMDIDGLGQAAIEQLVGSGRVKNISDLYGLTVFDLVNLDLFADKKADNLLKAIAASKNRPLARFIFSLGVNHVGAKTAEILAQNFKTIDALQNAPFQEMQKINEIGPVIARSIADFFEATTVKEELLKLHKYGLQFSAPLQNTSARLSGKTFVFTGELKTMSRHDAELLAKQNGAKTAGSISAKTFAIVAGQAAGSKLEKAKTLGVIILSEQEFFELIK